MKTTINDNKIHYFIYLLLVTMSVFSCKKELLYKDDPGIYIDKSKFPGSTDSIAYSFAEKSESLLLDTIYIPVKISGEMANTDRIVPLVANKLQTTATEGTHYQILETRVKANELTARVPVLVKRTADLKSKQVRIYLEIVPNADFPLVISYTKTNNTYNGEQQYIYKPGYLIKLSDQLLKPDSWDASGSWFKYYFGAYSEVKYKFIIQVTGRSVWGDRARYGADAPTSAEMHFYYAQLVSALYDYEQANGPMIDETGNQVIFPKL